MSEFDKLNGAPSDDEPQKASGEDEFQKPSGEDESQKASGKDEPQEASGKDEPQEASGKDDPQDASGNDKPQEASGVDEFKKASDDGGPQKAPGKDGPQKAPGKDEPQKAPGKDEPQKAPGESEPLQSSEKRMPRLNRRTSHLINNPVADLDLDKPKPDSKVKKTIVSLKSKVNIQRIPSLATIKKSSCEVSPAKEMKVIRKPLKRPLGSSRVENANETSQASSGQPPQKKHKPITWP